MKKKYILVFFLILSIFSFANFNDNINLLKEEDKKLIEEKISEISSQKKITIFVNTLSLDEGFAISNPEHAVIFNLKKADGIKKFSVEISLSKDIDVEDYKAEIDEMLLSTEEILKQGEYAKYILATLDGLETVLENVEIEPLNQMTMTKEQEEKGSNIFILLAIGILIAIAIVAILYKLEKSDEKN